MTRLKQKLLNINVLKVCEYYRRSLPLLDRFFYVDMDVDVVLLHYSKWFNRYQTRVCCEKLKKKTNKYARDIVKDKTSIFMSVIDKIHALWCKIILDFVVDMTSSKPTRYRWFFMHNIFQYTPHKTRNYMRYFKGFGLARNP